MKAIVCTCQKIVHICNKRKKSLAGRSIAQNRYLKIVQVVEDISLHASKAMSCLPNATMLTWQGETPHWQERAELAATLSTQDSVEHQL